MKLRSPLTGGQVGRNFPKEIKLRNCEENTDPRPGDRRDRGPGPSDPGRCGPIEINYIMWNRRSITRTQYIKNKDSPVVTSPTIHRPICTPTTTCVDFSRSEARHRCHPSISTSNRSSTGPVFLNPTQTTSGDLEKWKSKDLLFFCVPTNSTVCPVSTPK